MIESIIDLLPGYIISVLCSVAQMVQFFFDMVENIVEKVENAGCQQFLLFHNFSKIPFSQSCLSRAKEGQTIIQPFLESF